MFSASMERIQFSGVDSNVYFLKLGFTLTDSPIPAPVSTDCDIIAGKINANSALQTEYELATQATMDFIESEIQVTEYSEIGNNNSKRIYAMSFYNTDKTRIVGYENPCTSNIGIGTTSAPAQLPDNDSYSSLYLIFR